MLKYQEYPLEDMFKLASDIVSRINVASLANTLTISNRIAFKSEKDKFDLNVMIELITYALLERIKVDSNTVFIAMYKEIITLKYNLRFSISKQRVFENFLIRFKEAANNATL